MGNNYFGTPTQAGSNRMARPLLAVRTDRQNGLVPNEEHAMKLSSITLAIPFAVLLAGTAIGQNNQSAPPASSPQTSPPQGQTMPRTTTPQEDMRSNPTGQPDQRYPTGTATGQGNPMPFENLDRNHVGYLTREDARNDPWLARNFDRCDVNHKDRITRTEYETCMHQPNR